MQNIGRYLVERELGHGHMAVVYLARDPDIQRVVAIKVLGKQFVEDAGFRQRFKLEGQFIATLNDRTIVPIFEYGEAEGQPYIVMPYLPGGTLAQRLTGAPWPLTEALAILDSIAQALDIAHQHNIVHRDLKPGNVLFDAAGNACLSDFGLAKLLGGAMALTSSGSMVGTPDYMSPEQWTSDDTLDGRSDVYSLGVIAFQLLTGTNPFHADSAPQVMFKHLQAPVPQLDAEALGLPPQINTVLAKALAKQPVERYATAGELVAALHALLLAPAVLEPEPLLPNKILLWGLVVLIFVTASAVLAINTNQSLRGRLTPTLTLSPTFTSVPSLTAVSATVQPTISGLPSATLRPPTRTPTVRVTRFTMTPAFLTPTLTQRATHTPRRLSPTPPATATQPPPLTPTPTFTQPPAPPDTPTLTPTQTVTPTPTIAPETPTPTPVPPEDTATVTPVL